MDNRPVGVFDSGLGGLTAARKIRSILPSEDIIYFGDTSRVPYGGRSREILLKYARQDVRFLRSFDIKAIVVACGTVSTTCLPQLQAENDLPVLGVVEPACRRAVAVSKTRHVGLIATAASVRSGTYEQIIHALDPDVTVTARACPLFVPLVENGYVERENQVTRLVAEDYLKPIKESGCDTLILGCTHYPVIAGIIGDLMGPSVTLIDSGRAAADHARRILEEKELLAGRDGKGSSSFFVSDDPAQFAQNAALFLGGQFRGRVEKVDITAYPDTI